MKKQVLPCYSQACQNKKNPKKSTKNLEDSRDVDDKNRPILPKITIPSNLNDIQARSNQVWKLDEVGFDPNVR